MIRRTTIANTTRTLIEAGGRVFSSLTVESVFRGHKVTIPAGWQLRSVLAGTHVCGFTACPSDEPGLVNMYLVDAPALRPGDMFTIEADNCLDEPQLWQGFKVRGAEAVGWESEKSGAV